MPSRESSLRQLPFVRDSLSFLYVEHARIEQDASAIAIIDKQGRTPVPCASLLTLVLGPGTTVTHAAIKAMANNGCQVAWVGEGMTRFYAHGSGETMSSRNLLRQATCWGDPGLHLEVALRMYEMRFGERPKAASSMDSLRGQEGLRVRKAYETEARRHNVAWKGRFYEAQKWETMDTANRALSMANAHLYAVCRSAIVSMGYSTGLGFIHSGHILAFVHDIADMYKLRYIIPLAFAQASSGDEDLDHRVRRACRTVFVESDLVGRIAEDLSALFDIAEVDTREKASIWLWDPEREAVPAGVNYGREWGYDDGNRDGDSI